jgi:hypothetical protein
MTEEIFGPLLPIIKVSDLPAYFIFIHFKGTREM